MSEIVGSGWWEIGKMSKLQKSGAREEINLSPLTDLLLAPVRVTSYCSGNKRAAVILWKSQSPMLCSISFSPPIEGNLPISSFGPMPNFKHSTYVKFVIHIPYCKTWNVLRKILKWCFVLVFVSLQKPDSSRQSKRKVLMWMACFLRNYAHLHQSSLPLKSQCIIIPLNLHPLGWNK